MKNVLYIGNALSNKGKTITVIETLSNCLREFCNIEVASNKSNKILRLIDMIKLVITKRHRADFVIIDTYSTINFYYALIVSRLSHWLNLKYIPVLHGGNLESRLKNNPKLCSLIFKNAYKLVSPSIFLQKTFEKYGYDNVTFIPNTIDINDYEFINRNIGNIKMLWVRSFSKIYNPEQAIYVLDELLKRGFEAELTMIGPEIDGSMSKAKLLAKEKKLNITFTGKLSKNEWIKMSEEHNVFINTTDFDNMPVSIIEAMALGLPIVSTNVGGMPYLIEHNLDGLLVPPRNVDLMVESLIIIKNNNSIREKLVANARLKVEQFDWKKVKPLWEYILA